jgi:hypothetical protein
MGAETFIVKAHGKNAAQAFQAAVQQACYDHGHSGYTGTIAEKGEYVMIPLPKDTNPRHFANMLIEDSDARIDDKWGPAGCFDLGNGEYMFFGWASS